MAVPSFVWGQFRGMQVPVARVAKLTGLEFKKLEEADVLHGAGASFSLSVNQVNDVVLS